MLAFLLIVTVVAVIAGPSLWVRRTIRRHAHALNYNMRTGREMARVLRYHGAEHKAIHAIENGVALTPDNVQSFSRFHPRCGTSFLFLVVVVSVVVVNVVVATAAPRKWTTCTSST